MNAKDILEELKPLGKESYKSVLCSYVEPLMEFALEIGEQIGPVTADLGKNSCQVPFAPDYIRKVQQRGYIGRKRKTAKC